MSLDKCFLSGYFHVDEQVPYGCSTSATLPDIVVSAETGGHTDERTLSVHVDIPSDVLGP